MYITDNIKYVGVTDKEIRLFENQFEVNGMLYNSYIILDDKIAVIDSVEKNFGTEWILNIKNVAGEKTVDYLIVEHMEPDHSANIMELVKEYPDITIVSTIGTFNMIRNFFGTEITFNKLVVNDSSNLLLGKHNLKFITAPMVHWPEVVMVYDESEKILFSANAFGKFGLEKTCENWEDDARRYYFGIVGKFGQQVLNTIKKLSQFEVNAICSLHGPIINENIAYYVDLYQKWASYTFEEKGVTICYTSVYGHTLQAVEMLETVLKENNIKVVCENVAKYDKSYAIANVFRYSNTVFATTTYNGGIFPAMKDFIDSLIERNFQNRYVAIIENGTWAPQCVKNITAMLSDLKDINIFEENVKIMSALSVTSKNQIQILANKIIENIK